MNLISIVIFFCCLLIVIWFIYNSCFNIPGLKFFNQKFKIIYVFLQLVIALMLITMVISVLWKDLNKAFSLFLHVRPIFLIETYGTILLNAMLAFGIMYKKITMKSISYLESINDNERVQKERIAITMITSIGQYFVLLCVVLDFLYLSIVFNKLLR